jgi:hypothetical protein
VEHLLRDIKDLGEAGSLSSHIQRLFASLQVRLCSVLRVEPGFNRFLLSRCLCKYLRG